MTKEPISELTDLIGWLQSTIEPIQGQQWQITLNSSDGNVEATANVVTSKAQRLGHSTTISRVVKVRFRLDRTKRTVFTTD